MGASSHLDQRGWGVRGGGRSPTCGCRKHTGQAFEASIVDFVPAQLTHHSEAQGTRSRTHTSAHSVSEGQQGPPPALACFTEIAGLLGVSDTGLNTPKSLAIVATSGSFVTEGLVLTPPTRPRQRMAFCVLVGTRFCHRCMAASWAGKFLILVGILLRNDVPTGRCRDPGRAA